MRVFCLHVCMYTMDVQCLWRSERVSDALELEIRMVVSHHGSHCVYVTL